MSRRVPLILAIASAALATAASAFAQMPARAPTKLTDEASVRDGRVQGFVRDDRGFGVAGVSIVALGTTMAAVRSDEQGRFSLALLPGEYVLRAAREGYVSTYRELIRVQTSGLIERTITVARQATARLADVVGGPLGRTPTFIDDAKDDDGTAHSEAAWRLRHLPQTAIRDVSPSNGLDERARNYASVSSTALFANTAFSGTVNFLTTGSLSAASGWLPSELPRGIAGVAVGAPVGSFGDWFVRGAMTTAGDLSSWALVGEYQARSERAHAFTLGVSHSAQLDARNVAAGSLPAAAGVARSVGGIYALDRWHATGSLDLEYGARLDRYDYVAGSALISPRVRARLKIRPGTRLIASAAQYMIAPGADEFLPPPTPGLWLPPERTFAPLLAGDLFEAERVRQYGIGFDQQIGRGAKRPVVGVERFHQSTANQIATLFGLDQPGENGHYYVAAPGSVSLDGWAVRLTGDFTARVRGAIDYSVSKASWIAGADVSDLARLVPSAIRGHEHLHDMTTSLEAVVPETSTHLSMWYRASSRYSRAADAGWSPFTGGRFDFEVRQLLPYRPLQGSKVEVLLSVRNLFRDPRNPGSLYDELLTVKPPMRIMGGVQVKF